MNIDRYLLYSGLGRGPSPAGKRCSNVGIEQVHPDATFLVIEDKGEIALGLSGSLSAFIDEKELQPQGAVGFS